jgi:hypothetical protein
VERCQKAMVLNSRGKVFTVIYFSFISHTYIHARLALGMQIKRKNIPIMVPFVVGVTAEPP